MMLNNLVNQLFYTINDATLRVILKEYKYFLGMFDGFTYKLKSCWSNAGEIIHP